MHIIQWQCSVLGLASERPAPVVGRSAEPECTAHMSTHSGALNGTSAHLDVVLRRQEHQENGARGPPRCSLCLRTAVGEPKGFEKLEQPRVTVSQL